jgi:hypothetical protein
LAGIPDGLFSQVEKLLEIKQNRDKNPSPNPGLHFYMKCLSVPQIVATRLKRAKRGIFEDRLASFHGIPALTTNPDSNCFVISLIAENSGASLLSQLTGIPFAQSPSDTLVIGTNIIQDDVNVIGELCNVCDMETPAIAFISAVSGSNTVIIDVKDFQELWNEMIYSCDTVWVEYGVQLQLSQIQIIIVGNSQPLKSEFPEGSFAEALRRLRMELDHSKMLIDKHFMPPIAHREISVPSFFETCLNIPLCSKQSETPDESCSQLIVI